MRQLRVVGVLAVACGLASGVFGQTPAAAPPVDRTQTEAMSKRAADRLAALQHEAEVLASREKTLLGELRALEVDRQIKVEQATIAEHALADTTAQIGSTRARLDALKTRAAVEQPDVEARLVRLYKMGRAGYWRMLFDVQDTRALGRAYRTASALGEIDRRRVEEHRQTVEGLRATERTLEQRAADLKDRTTRALAARRAVDRAVAAHTALVASIDARRDLNAELAGELQDAHRRLQAALVELGAGHAATPVALPFKPFKGAIPWPADGIVISRFGQPGSGRFRATTVRSGIEISIAEGQPVHAVHDGTVEFADAFTGYGNVVIVDHGEGVYSLYGNLGSLAVHRGDHLGTAGLVGTSGRSTAGNPTLFFELRIDGQPVDPLQWLKRR